MVGFGDDAGFDVNAILSVLSLVLTGTARVFRLFGVTQVHVRPNAPIQLTAVARDLTLTLLH